MGLLDLLEDVTSNAVTIFSEGYIYLGMLGMLILLTYLGYKSWGVWGALGSFLVVGSISVLYFIVVEVWNDD